MSVVTRSRRMFSSSVTHSSWMFGFASGQAKLPAIRAAMVGGLINGLITSEATAERLLA